MVEMTIADVERIRQQRGQFAYNRFCIYLVRDKDQALYVGKSERNVIRRLTEHWGNPDEDGYLHRHPSDLGQHVLSQWPSPERLTGSHAWQVELYTLVDCVPIVHWYDDCITHTTVDTAEQAMISRHRPRFNYAGNYPRPDRDPSRLAPEVAEMYAEIRRFAEEWRGENGCLMTLSGDLLE